ncbi:MAG: DUF3307 domain-containing protein, partial [Chloroflexi bacterium]|nr:DUF3307 domain-containing protein [Chloroflexota bacterium]
YVLQSNWLVSRKGKAWTALALHGTIVGFVALAALAPYLEQVWFVLIVLVAVHSLQDALKVRYGPHLRIHSIIPYMSDQFAHYALIVALDQWAGGRMSPPPGDLEIAFMWTGAAVLAVTRFYDVTLWANWLDMIPYMNRWRLIGYTERIAMMALATAGLWFIAPLCAIPRLAISYRRQRPIWKQRRGVLEMTAGALLSIILGIGLQLVYAPV